MNDENTQPDPSEADNQAAGDKAAEGDDEVSSDEENAEASSDVQSEGETTNGESTESETDTSEVAIDPTENVESNVVDSGEDTPVVPEGHTALDYGQHMEVNVNGTQYAGHPLIVPTHLVDTVKTILFHAHGESPNSEVANENEA